MNTNLEVAYNLVLDIAIINHITLEELTTYIV